MLLRIQTRWPITLAIVLSSVAARADWPTLRGSADRAGRVETAIQAPFRVVWARYFDQERLGSAMEPVVADGKVFAATHAGRVHALDAPTGRELWRFQAGGAFLHSPAVAAGTVLAACTDGNLYALDAQSGKPRWTVSLGRGGASASPTVAEGLVLIGTRAGDFLAVDLASGAIRWRQSGQAPIRQTAAVSEGRVYVTAEDLQVRAFEIATGRLLWTSAPLWGQSARDYYPVVVRSGNRTLVVVRTNPVTKMSDRIAQDRRVICQAAGVDDRDWRNLEKWSQSPEAQGNPAAWDREQAGIETYLVEHSEARTFFVLDAETGKEAMVPPVLWGAGCQGVAAPPVLLPDGRLLVFYRTVYANWNMGVAPLVALGAFDPARNRIEPFLHASGKQPPWNTFWGTADESQNFLVAGKTLVIIHQGTLSGFDLVTKKLFPIAGNRDSWGGFRNLPWARNEWHGPARSGVAVVGDRIYWQTGSRILAVAAGEQGGDRVAGVERSEPPGGDAPLAVPQSPSASPLPDSVQLRRDLAAAVEEVLSRRWAPLYIEPGLAGREFSFDQSGEVFEALAWAYPYLEPELRGRVKAYLAAEWAKYPPYTRQAWYPLGEGVRREKFRVPPDLLSRLGSDPAPHPFGNVAAIERYADRCGEWERVLAAWPQLKACYSDFAGSGWKLDAARGDLFANRYLASLGALVRIARRVGDQATAAEATAQADQTAKTLAVWWQRAGEHAKLTTVANVGEVDAFIGGGNALFFRVVPHKAKVALFHDLTPEAAAAVQPAIAGDVKKIWPAFELLCPTWHLAGEERQVHYGENFADPPDAVADAFKTLAWLVDAPPDQLARRLDIPASPADLDYVTKVAVILERMGK
ncbi:MAG: outer membrane protein assembly factor BamB family protein [Pirellulales bacterium]